MYTRNKFIYLFMDNFTKIKKITWTKKIVTNTIIVLEQEKYFFKTIKFLLINYKYKK